jgi:hypothetical protein
VGHEKFRTPALQTPDFESSTVAEAISDPAATRRPCGSGRGRYRLWLPKPGGVGRIPILKALNAITQGNECHHRGIEDKLEVAATEDALKRRATSDKSLAPTRTSPKLMLPRGLHAFFA